MAINQFGSKPIRLTAQASFEQIATHLFAQGERSINSDDTSCQYRGAKGLKCAIGCLIPDNQYAKRIEGASVEDVQLMEILSAAGLPAYDKRYMELLDSLQQVHDRAGHWENNATMKGQLRRVGYGFGLSSDFLENLILATVSN
jgi:hypothetical protein